MTPRERHNVVLIFSLFLVVVVLVLGGQLLTILLEKN